MAYCPASPDDHPSDGETDHPVPGLVTRRGVLLGAAGVLVAAGAGVGAGYLPALRASRHVVVPADLVAALAAERLLLARIDASATGPGLRGRLEPVRADHAAHAATLSNMIEQLTGRTAPPDTTAPQPAVTAAALRAAELRASAEAAARATRLHGDLATVLASIAAAEATHAELLS